jgi:hypothetical protein
MEKFKSVVKSAVMDMYEFCKKHKLFLFGVVVLYLYNKYIKDSGRA